MLLDDGVDESLISRRSRFISRGIRLTSIARRDDGNRSGRLSPGLMRNMSSNSFRHASQPLNGLLPMMARTVESAMYAAIIPVRFTGRRSDGDGEDEATASGDG